MSHSIFGRGESEGSVRLSELYMIWAMLNAHAVDTGSHMIRHMLSVAKSGSGEIVLGGLITPIAIHYGLDLSNLEQARGSNRLDYEVCANMKMIERMGSWYYLKFKEDPNYTFTLPNPRYTSVRQPRNWKYDFTIPPPPPYVEGQEDEPIPLQIDYSGPSSSFHVGPSDVPTGGATLDSIFGLLSSMDTRQHDMDARMRRVETLCDMMYSWHLSQDPDFPPLHPLPPPLI